ncbi:MAG: type 2 periplasmic-binding domain-containing protein [Dermatophilaceae bacterium]
MKGSTPTANIQKKYPGVQLQEYDTYSKCVEAPVGGAVDALTTDNTILAGYASQPAYKGKLKVVGKTFSTEKYGIGLKKGDTALCQKVTTTINTMISSGDWQKAVDAFQGASAAPRQLDGRRRSPRFRGAPVPSRVRRRCSGRSPAQLNGGLRRSLPVASYAI